MNSFQNMTNFKEITNAISIAENLLISDSKLYESIFAKNDWKYDKIKSGAEVAYNLVEIQRKPIHVLTYKPWNPWTKAIGYFDGKAIHINTRKLPFMTTVEIAANLVHEYAHYCGYSHGSNFKTGFKCKYSVPYFLSENIEKWIQ